MGLERRPGGDQDHRAGDRGPRLGRGLDHRRRRRSRAPAGPSRSSGPGRRGWPRRTSSTRPGHLVTVFERAGRIGGLLMYGIPNMKLDKDVVARRDRLMEAEGVTFRTGVTVGADVAADELAGELRRRRAGDRRHRRARPRRPRPRARRDPPGDELPARQHAAAAGRRRRRPRPRSTPRARTSSSSAAATPARTAWGRRSARARGASASWSCSPGRRSSARADNPWPEWPKVYKLDYGQEEAAALWGEDPRRYSTTTRRFIGRNERVTGARDRGHLLAAGPGRARRRCARSRARPR